MERTGYRARVPLHGVSPASPPSQGCWRLSPRGGRARAEVVIDTVRSSLRLPGPPNIAGPIEPDRALGVVGIGHQYSPFLVAILVPNDECQSVEVVRPPAVGRAAGGRGLDIAGLREAAGTAAANDAAGPHERVFGECGNRVGAAGRERAGARQETE